MDTQRAALENAMDHFSKHGDTLKDFKREAKEITSADESSLEDKSKSK